MDDLFVMQPLTQYDLYCMARGVYSNAKVAAVQTNEDAKEEEAQTEEVRGWWLWAGGRGGCSWAWQWFGVLLGCAALSGQFRLSLVS